MKCKKHGEWQDLFYPKGCPMCISIELNKDPRNQKKKEVQHGHTEN